MRLLQAGLAKVRQEFIASLPGRAEELDRLMDQLYDEVADKRVVVETISQRAHQFHGQAGAFGFPDMGMIAAKVEHAAAHLLENADELDPEALETHLITLLDMIHESLEAA